MGLSIPITNLKNFDMFRTDGWYINYKPAGVFAHYLVLRDYDFSEIDELVYNIQTSVPDNINDDFNVTLDLDQTTVLKTWSVGGGIADQLIERGWIDVSAYTGVHQFGLLWDQDINNDNNLVRIDFMELWGKNGIV